MEWEISLVEGKVMGSRAGQKKNRIEIFIPNIEIAILHQIAWLNCWNHRNRMI
jgi:hypothetical protein